MNLDARQIIKLALVTEKGAVQREKYNQYLFDVHPKANKVQIRRAIETIFPVKVESVQTMHCQGKLKRVGQRVGRRSAWKKAVVRLKAGQSIDLLDTI